MVRYQVSGPLSKMGNTLSVSMTTKEVAHAGKLALSRMGDTLSVATTEGSGNRVFQDALGMSGQPAQQVAL